MIGNQATRLPVKMIVHQLAKHRVLFVCIESMLVAHDSIGGRSIVK